jgi:hypothetical protein
LIEWSWDVEKYIHKVHRKSCAVNYVKIFDLQILYIVSRPKNIFQFLYSFLYTSLHIKVSLSNWLWRRVIPYTWFRLWAHGGCDRSAEDAYSSMAPDPAFAFRVALHSILYLLFRLHVWLRFTHCYYIAILYLKDSHNSQNQRVHIKCMKNNIYETAIIIRHILQKHSSKVDSKINL